MVFDMTVPLHAQFDYHKRFQLIRFIAEVFRVKNLKTLVPCPNSPKVCRARFHAGYSEQSIERF